MDTADPPERDALCRDWFSITAALAARHSPNRQASSTSAWQTWERFCSTVGRRADLLDVPGDTVPMLMLFAYRYRTGAIAPSDRPVRSRTVEEAVRQVAQAFTRVGSPDPRVNSFGLLDYRLQILFRSWKKSDSPPTRVKPLPLLVLRSAHRVALACAPNVRFSPAGDCLVLAYFFLLRPGEYSGIPRTASDDLFRIQDVGIWIGHRRLHPLHCSTAELHAASFVSLTFTSQKNGVRGETIGHGRSGHPTLCPVAALTRRLVDLRACGATLTTPLNGFRASADDPWRHITPSDVTALLRHALLLLPPSLTDFSAQDISARSARAGGAMAMLCGGIDSDRIRLIGRWRSDEMYRYLHVQAQPIMSGVAAVMLRGGDYCLLSPPSVAPPW